MANTPTEDKQTQIVNAVHSDIPFFRKHWTKFCQMVEDYGEHVKNCMNDPKFKYDIKERDRLSERRDEIYEDGVELVRRIEEARTGGDEEAVKRYRQAKEQKELEYQAAPSELAPPEPGCVLYHWDEPCFLKNHIVCAPKDDLFRRFWIKPGPVNPLRWFRQPAAYTQPQNLQGEELIIYSCALLSMAHDIWEDLGPGEPRIFYCEPYQGKLFQRDKFCEDLWYTPVKDWPSSDRLAEVERAWGRVLPVIEKDAHKPSKTGLKDEPDDGGDKKPKRISKAETPQQEYSLPLTMKKWASIFGVSENALRKLRDEKKYHFVKVNARAWKLPKDELPTEYLEKYRQHTSQSQPKAH